ncbi:uncharacterized protein [Euphorbia lathyris]|uniref:uncharacterized protein n=1 Tax=Euphorbia lathyris TaxID=212925 RepID=UPI0033134F1F
MLDQQNGTERLFSFIFPLFLFCLFSISQHFYLLQVCTYLSLSFIIGEKMDTIPENVATEIILGTDSIFAIKENHPISEIQQSACMVPEGNSETIVKTSASKDGHVRRNSTGNIGIPYRNVKILSRYLATSKSSCHDQCKYGMKQDLDVNMFGSRTLKTIAEKHTRGYYIGKPVALAEGKKKSAVRFLPSGSRSQKTDSPVATRREISSNRKRDLFKQFSLPLRGLVPRSDPTLSKLSSLEDHSGSKEFGTDVRDNHVKATSVQNLDGVSSNRKQTIRNAKQETNKLNGKKVLSRANVPLSSLHSVKKVVTRPIVSLAPKRSGKRYISAKNEQLKTLKVVSHLHNDVSSKHPRKDISIDQLSPNSTAKPPRRTQYKQGTLVSDSSTSQHQATNREKRSTNAESTKIKPMRDRVVRAKDKESTARKVNFRKGKVIENHQDIITSRRLKFKQRSLSDTLVVDVEKIKSNFGSREIHVDGVEMNGAKSESENVVLKHKDGDEDKKGPQNLLNNVIEETANKLSETKRSKVKVLVGAFESVISLRDSKQASMVDAS